MEQNNLERIRDQIYHIVANMQELKQNFENSGKTVHEKGNNGRYWRNTEGNY